ncbi:hypothetical protein B0A50_07657 [Salinomyces thailandicus]|uniref:Uncharacterized protein n=1 Tax=Salinomyces thailandicus TaxID=706561 RepID=A0A4U0TL41_9PEZI|nr:hypothetical protein B0A50_07657 [Salinomyces thailandica]
MAKEEETPTTGFTAGETKLLMCLIKHLKGDLPSDFDAVAAELGYKDGAIVKTRWGQIKRKKITAGLTASGNAGTITPRKRKAKAAAGVDGDGDDEEVTPKAKRGGKKVKTQEMEEEAVTKKEAEDDEVEGEEIAVEGTE